MGSPIRSSWLAQSCCVRFGPEDASLSGRAMRVSAAAETLIVQASVPEAGPRLWPQVTWRVAG